jgi:hypothetical protein
MNAVLMMGILMPMLMAAVFLLARHLYRRPYAGDELSPVSRQHIDLFQGGQLNEAAVESAKTHFRELLERGEVAAVEASLRPGTQFVVQVRALAELGTDDAGRILERQLQRRLTEDQIEQSWYWIDLANGLRSLNRPQSVPHLLRCAEAARESPLGHFFAAETICFLSFVGYVRQRETALGQSALRVLHRALEGLRSGVPPQVVAEARLGELIETLWDNRPDTPDPLLIRVFLESIRVWRRAPHAEPLLSSEAAEQEAFNWQMTRIEALLPVFDEYLQESAGPLARELPGASENRQRDLLLALIDLRAETADVLLPLLQQGRFTHTESALEALTWSRDRRVGPFLRDWVTRCVPMLRRAQARRRAAPPSRASIAGGFPYRAVLRALRGRPAPETEAMLVLASRDWDPTIRAAAVSSLGWWEPIHGKELLAALQEARRDPNADVRQSARAALARLGERQALQWFRQGLGSDDIQRRHETIQLIAAESLMLLWPDLDQLADAEDADVAHHAREALERLREEMDSPRPH